MIRELQLPDREYKRSGTKQRPRLKYTASQIRLDFTRLAATVTLANPGGNRVVLDLGGTYPTYFHFQRIR